MTTCWMTDKRQGVQPHNIVNHRPCLVFIFQSLDHNNFTNDASCYNASTLLVS